MKKILALFLLVASVACAQPVTKIGWIDELGAQHNVSASEPMPVTSTAGAPASGTQVNPPPDVGSTAVTINTATAGISLTVTALANRQRLSFFAGTYATETVWVTLGSTTAVVGRGIPIYAGGYWSDDLDYSVPVGVVSSTPSSINVVQTGY